MYTDGRLMAGLIGSVNIFRVVVFPAPFGPKNPTHFDPSILKFRSDTTTNELKCLEIFRASIDGFVKVIISHCSYLVIALLNTGRATAVITIPNTMSIVSSVVIAGMSAPSTMTFLRAVEA